MLVTVLVFLSSACADDFLEFIPEDQATVDAWYRNREEIRQSTAALYGRPWWGYSDQFSWLAGDLMAGHVFVYVCGIVQTALYVDFFYYYLKSRWYGQKIVLPC